MSREKWGEMVFRPETWVALVRGHGGARIDWCAVPMSRTCSRFGRGVVAKKRRYQAFICGEAAPLSR